MRLSDRSTVAAHDAERGIASTIENHPDLILLDIRMPGMDGLTALTHLQQLDETKSTPVIMLSASLIDQRHALDLGACFFLEKPYDPKALLDAVESALEPTTVIDSR